jgi:hypothetical protein
MVNNSACHAKDPSSFPGGGVLSLAHSVDGNVPGRAFHLIILCPTGKTNLKFNGHCTSTHFLKQTMYSPRRKPVTAVLLD